jgi:hypothetical protein
MQRIRMKRTQLIFFLLGGVGAGCDHKREAEPDLLASLPVAHEEALLSGLPISHTIDATSIESVLASLRGESEENGLVIRTLLCHSGDGLDPDEPNIQASALEKLRSRLHGRTVSAVVAEVAIQQNAGKEVLQRSAGNFVREKRAGWLERARHCPLVQPGIAGSRVIELLGEPDGKADSPAAENWLYRYDAAHNEEQIWVATVVVTIVDGTVTKAQRSHEGQAIDEMIKRLGSSARRESPNGSKPAAK